MRPLHEIRDPIHVFIRLDSDERRLLDSVAIQRLRHIHQLAMTYLVYPGATHRRFEHSLGVMELATRIYDVIIDHANLTDSVRNILPEGFDVHYWRRVLRVAALCHDVGHMPFSHAAEKELLPSGMSHEDLTRMVIYSEELLNVFRLLKVDPEHVAKIALGPSKISLDVVFTPWEEILADIITGDAFGADRMDYLLRDSHHTGVGYGRFDHYRLIDTLRILPCPPEDPKDQEDDRGRIALGVAEGGGLQGVEALLLARYLIYSQVYFHPIRRIYDIHLTEFLQQWLPEGRYPTAVEEHLRLTDNEVLVAMARAAEDPSQPGHDAAKAIMRRQHFKLVYQASREDFAVHPDPGLAVLEALEERFPRGRFHRDKVVQKGAAPNFPVQRRGGEVAWSLSLSPLLNQVPNLVVDYVFADRSVADEAKRWVHRHRAEILQKDGGS